MIINSFMKKLFQICVSALLLAAFNTSAITLYKWVDAEGKISYQGQPPPPGQKYEEKSFTEEGVNTQTSIDLKREQAAISAPATLYMTQECDSCELVRKVFDLHAVPYLEVDVENDSEAQEGLKKLTGALRIPSVTIGDKVISGFDRNKIEDTLISKGYPLGSADIE